MEIFEVKTAYIDYLRRFDKKVMINEEDGVLRKYIGIIFTIDTFNYFVPLSSPKDSDYIYKNGGKEIRKSIVPLHRIIIDINGHIDFLGKLKFSSMIPVPDSELNLLNVDEIADKKYKNLLNKQIIYIRKSKTILEKRHAEVIYKQKVNRQENIAYLENTVDFKLLEQKCLEYSTKNTSKWGQAV